MRNILPKKIKPNVKKRVYKAQAMKEKIHIENNKHLKENTFKVPDGYFENVTAKLQIIAKDPVFTVVSKRRESPKTWFRVAAVLIVLCGASWVFWPKTQTPDNALSAEDILLLSENGYFSITEQAILQTFSEAEILALADNYGYDPAAEDEDMMQSALYTVEY